jgi:hypothetical protein
MGQASRLAEPMLLVINRYHMPVVAYFTQEFSDLLNSLTIVLDKRLRMDAQ